jgi:hypothetical protein
MILEKSIKYSMFLEIKSRFLKIFLENFDFVKTLKSQSSSNNHSAVIIAELITFTREKEINRQRKFFNFETSSLSSYFLYVLFRLILNQMTIV